MPTPQPREVWKNVTPGLRYYIEMDPLGRQTHGLVQAGRTFTITPLERQINQQGAASPEQDMFRNGSFVLVQETDETILDEVVSPNSVSDGEIEVAVHEALAGDEESIMQILDNVSSAVTAQRVLEELVVQDGPASLVEAAKAKVDEYTERPIGADGKPMEIVERETVQEPVASTAAAFSEQKAIRPR